MSTATTTLAGLRDVLVDLAAALETGHADAVLAIEPRLVAGVDALRLVRDGAPEDAPLVAEIHDRIAACRRLGGTIPALLSVMFPGRVSYGRPGQAAPVPVSSRSQVV